MARKAYDRAVDRTGRRRFLRIGAALGLGAPALDAFAIEPLWLDVNRLVVDVPGLPSELDGFTIAHVTDVHISSIGRIHRALARAIGEASPDLVVLTGDVIDVAARVDIVTEFVGALRSGRAQVIATLGNWEHWGGVNLGVLAERYARAGARLLTNESVVVDRGLAVVGTDDGSSTLADLRRSFRGVAEDRPRLLLTHAPGILEDRVPPTARAALTLAGHTHGGQVRALSRAIIVPPGSGSFVAGSYATAVGPLYVSRGIGMSRIPARFACRPELPILRLRRGEAARIVES